MEKKYYVILSEGAYSDYEPIYFVGANALSQEELDKKGREIGDKLFDLFDALPKRPHLTGKYHGIHYSNCPTEESYWPETNEKAWGGELAPKWMNEMTEWLHSLGFEELPKEIPEINVAYSEIPTNYSRPPHY